MKLGITSPEQADPQIATFVSSLSALYEHGGVIFRGYIDSADQPWGESCSNPQALLRHVLLSVPDLVPELAAPRLSDKLPPNSMLTPNNLVVNLASLLTLGGCYRKFSGTTDDARKLAQSFVQAVVGQSRPTAHIFTIDGQWTPWFSPIICASFIIVLPMDRRWFLFCATDED